MAGMTTSEKIKLVRKRLGWSQGDLATATGYSQEQISGWERERTEPSASQLKALADAMTVSTDYLLDPKQTEPPPIPLTDRQKRIWQVVVDLGWDEAYRRLLDTAKVIPPTSVTTVLRGDSKKPDGGNGPAKP